MPRGGIKEKINNIGRGPRERVALCPPSALLLAPFFSRGFVYRSSFFAPKPHGNACYAGYGGPRERCRSVPRDGIKRKDRWRTERAVSLCATTTLSVNLIEYTIACLIVNYL